MSNRVERASSIRGCIGFIDGTHIRLASSPGGERDYFNRKGFPSIQLQIVVNDNLLITSAFAGYPGYTHDARVFRNGTLSRQLEGGQLPLLPGGFIVGDSAYPLKSWLITPFKDNGRLTGQHRRYNRTVSSQRQAIERAIGLLKGRFRRLREIPMHDPEDICTMIVAACIMHNVCITAGDTGDDFVEVDVDDQPSSPGCSDDCNADGVQKRLDIMRRL